jgi:hypothetical protein
MLLRVRFCQLCANFVGKFIPQD